MTRETMDRIGPDERLYLPSVGRQISYTLLFLTRVSLFILLILVTGLWLWAATILIAFLVAGVAIGFPRHYFGYCMITSSDLLIYRSRRGEEKIVRWQEVTAYRFGGMWVQLLNDEGQVRFLFSRPLLVEGAREFRTEVMERCAQARRLSLFGYVKLVLRSAKQALQGRRHSESNR